MKRVYYFISVFIAAVFYNLLGYGTLEFGRLARPSFWMLSVLLAIVFLLFSFYISTCFNFFNNRRKRPYSMAFAEPKEKIKIATRSDGEFFRYILLATIPPLLLFSGLVYFMIAGREGAWPMFVKNVKYRGPVLFVYLAFYALVIYYKRSISWGGVPKGNSVQELKLPRLDDKHIDLYILFGYLYRVQGMGPVYGENREVRFLDVVCIMSTSKEHTLILSDGTMVRNDKIMQRLEQRGLSPWMVKISDRIRVNMMLVQYPISQPNTRLELQKEVMEGLLRGLKRTEILLLLKCGAGIKGKHIITFLENRNSLEHKGWDDLIPMG